MLHPFSGFLGVSIMRNVGSGGMQPATEEIDPDARLGAQQEVGRHEPDFGKLLFQVFVDDCRLVNDPVSIDQDGHFAVGILLDQVFGFVFEIDFNGFVREFLFSQDNPCPMGIGSGTAGVEFHH
jgi:hypothetical protein